MSEFCQDCDIGNKHWYGYNIKLCKKHAATDDLLDACKFASEALNDMTSAEFSRGVDAPVRAKLEAAIAKAEPKP